MGQCFCKTDGNYTIENSKPFTLKGKYKAKIIEVYDGDTVTAVIKFKGEYVRVNIRLLGYDAPELRPSKTIQNRQYIICQANIAKEQLTSYVLNKFVTLEITSNDKYGNRWLGNLYIDGISINNEMLKNPNCKLYSGGKKG